MDANAFASQELLLCCIILVISVFSSYIIQRTGYLGGVPVSGVAMVLGVIWGGLLQLGGSDMSKGVSFAPEAFFFGLLPPIIYAAGFTLRHKDFFKNFGSILLFAVVGTIISTFVFGMCTYLLYLMGANAFWRSTVTSLTPCKGRGRAFGQISPSLFESPLLECLIYGSLISAIDPVATLSIFSELNAAPLLYNLVFGESVLNDAVAIVLFRVLTLLHGSGSFTFSTIPYVLFQFMAMCLGSIFVGVVIAGVTALLLKVLKMHVAPDAASSAGPTPNVVYSVSVLFLSAYLSYLVAEVAGFSGIMSLFFTGVCHAHYCFYNVSEESRATTTNAFNTMAFLCETFVFTYLGLQVVVMHHCVDLGLLLSGVPLCILSRAANIFPLAALANSVRRVQIPFSVQRGAIAYALAMNMPYGDLRESRVIETSTLTIVVVTTLVFGGATGPLLDYLNLKGQLGDGQESDPSALSSSLLGTESIPTRSHPEGLNQIGQSSSSSYEGFHKLWKHVDRHLVRVLRAQPGSADCFGPGGEERVVTATQARFLEHGDSTDLLFVQPYVVQQGAEAPHVPLSASVLMEEFPSGYESPQLHTVY